MISIVALIAELLLLIAIKSIGITINDIGVSALILGFSISFFASVQRNRILRECKLQLLLGYFLRIFFLYFDLFGRNIFVLPNSGADTEMFYVGSVYYMNYGGSTRTYFPLVMGTLFRLIGSNRLYNQFLLMLLSMVSLCLLVYMLSELGLSREQKIKVVGITALLPNLAILSSVFMRESLVAVFVTLSIYFFVLWIQRKRELFYILALIMILPASLMHSGAAGILPGYLAIRLIYDKNTKTIKMKFTNLFVAIVLAIGVGYVFINYGDFLLSKLGNVDSLEDIANMNDMAASSYVRYVGNSNTIQNVIIYTVPRIAYFLYSPFPWQWRGIADYIAFFFSSTFYLVATWSTINCLINRRNPHRNMVVIFSIIALTTVFVFGWGVSNSGTAVRHREKLTMLFAVIWALGSEGRRSWLHVRAGNMRLF